MVTFFLRKKKVTRAGARNAPSRARRRNTCSPPGRRPRASVSLSPTAPFLPTAEEMGERTPAETAFLHFLSALCLFAAARAFPHVTGVFLIVVVPPTVPAQLSAAAACYYGKNYSFCCVAGYYILCPTGTPTHCGAPRRNGRDLIIAKNDQRTSPYPRCCQRQRRKRYKRSPEPTTSPAAPIPRSRHRQICTCPPRAKGPLDRRSKRLSFPHFFLRRKKCGRRRLAPAGATPAHSRARKS